MHLLLRIHSVKCCVITGWEHHFRPSLSYQADWFWFSCVHGRRQKVQHILWYYWILLSWSVARKQVGTAHCWETAHPVGLWSCLLSLCLFLYLVFWLSPSFLNQLLESTCSLYANVISTFLQCLHSRWFVSLVPGIHGWKPRKECLVSAVCACMKLISLHHYFA